MHVGNQLDTEVDILGFKHLNLELTVARVEVIRDAILELMGNEMGPSLTPHMAEGVLQVLNYVGGALIYIRSHYAERVKILNQSWEEANCEREKKKEKQKDAQERAKAEACLIDQYIPTKTTTIDFPDTIQEFPGESLLLLERVSGAYANSFHLAVEANPD